MTATVWSNNIVSLASFRTSVNQTDLNVLDADVSADEELVVDSTVFESVLTAVSQSVLGFVSCLSDADLLIGALG